MAVTQQGGAEVGERDAGGRGRRASEPSEIPAKGWWDILRRTWSEIGTDHVGLVAAGMAFYALLAIFPAIATLVSLWGIFADPGQIEQQMAGATALLPPDAAEILIEQARSVAAQAGAGVTLAALGGIILSFYSASKGIQATMEGLNVAYNEQETRGFVQLTMVKLGLSLAIFGGAIAGILSAILLPALLGNLGLGEAGRSLAAILRWPLLFALAMAGLAIIYRFAPDRDEPRWQWISPGALLATALWVAGSILFSLYVRYFGNYNETYGSLGAVIIALMWFWLSSFIILIGAELNAEMERQTVKDTTEGHKEPLGERGAYAADTVGEAN